MRYLITLLALLTAAPAYAGPEMLLPILTNYGGPVVTTAFDYDDPQGWSNSNFNLAGSPLAHSQPVFAAGFQGTTATLNKTVLTGEGTFSVWAYQVDSQNSSENTCTFRVDSGALVPCVPSTTGVWQKFSQSVSAGTHTLNVTVANLSSVRAIYIDDISYVHPGLPLWTAKNQINGISSVYESGPTDTGTQTGVMSSGTIQVTAECANSQNVVTEVFLVVDGVEVDLLTCPQAGSNGATLQHAVTAGSHSVRLHGTVSGAGGTFSATLDSVPMP